jgi:hypothetical protein
VSTGGVVTRFGAGLVCGVAVVAIFVGCSGIAGRAVPPRASGVLAAGDRSGSWASTRELAWLRRLGAWNSRLLAGLGEAARIEGSPALVGKLLRHDAGTTRDHRAALAVARTCSADLRHDVGPPPTARLRPATAALESACVHLQRFHDAIELAITQGRNGLLRDAQAEVANAGRLLLQADSGLPPGEVRSLPVIGGDSGVSRIEPRLGKVASWLAGKPVEVRCWSHPDWTRLLREENAYTKRIDSDTVGFAGIQGNRVNLAPDVCDGLVDLTYHGSRPPDDTARFPLATAVVTLAHEPEHAKGVADEAQAECYAIQLAAPTARRLGVPAAYASGLARLYWEHYPEELSQYRSPECRDGGAYDLRRSTSAWP